MRKFFGVILFLGAFLLPLLLLLGLKETLFHVDSSSGTEEQLPFKTFLRVVSSDQSVQIFNSPQLDPKAGSDFFFSVWFSLQKLPAAGERWFLASKYEAASASRAGYAIAIENKNGTIHPSIYWMGKEGQGAWYSFSPTKLEPKKWYLLLLSHLDGKVVALHFHEFDPAFGSKGLFAGGIDVSQTEVVESNADLFLGSVGSGLFRGRIGPLTILNAEKGKFTPEEVVSLLVTTTGVPEFANLGFSIGFSLKDWNNAGQPALFKRKGAKAIEF